MGPDAFAEALILTGPTASGKSAVGLALAERLGAEIVSMDSMALYRGLDLGTAKPTAAERRRVPHHLLDLVAPWEAASVAWWLEQAARTVADVRSRGRHALIVGGTALYLKALLRGLFEGPPANPARRRELEQLPGAELHARLTRVDPAAAARLHPNDVRRLVRALEVFEATGRPISEQQREFHRVRPWARPPLWLDWPRPLLYARIDRRVDQMLAAGLVEEVRGLTQLPQPLSKEARQALGYKELLDHLAGQTSLDEAAQLIRTRSRQFAKRQLTWFRHLEECAAVPVEGTEGVEELAQRVAQRWGMATP